MVCERSKTSSTEAMQSHFDVLSDVLETLRLRGSVFFRSELSAPWGIEFPRMASPMAHVALRGTFHVGADASTTVRVDDGTIAVLPVGVSHWVADEENSPRATADATQSACQLNSPLFQTGVITHRLMCVIFTFDAQSKHPFLDSLPTVLHFPELGQDSTIWMTVSLISRGLDDGEDSRVVDRLAEALFLQLLKEHVARAGSESGFLAGLADHRLRHALTLIHKSPGSDWTLELLSERVGMSHSTFVRRFQDAVGTAPMTYLANWRVAKAYNMVKYTGHGLEHIAATVGFASSRTFTRAFQRTYGVTPGELRKTTSETP